jgi:hypothetical protein
VREHLAENMKERVYATITLIAVVTSLWQTADHQTAGGAIAGIGGTVAALWAATVIAARVSHRAVHRKSMSEVSLAKLLFTSSGLLVPAFLPVVLVLVSRTGVVSLKGALLASMIALLLSLFTLSFMGVRRIYTSPWRAFSISLIETSVGIGVVLLKLVVGE